MRQLWELVLLMTLAAAAGCGGQNYTSPERYERGLVVCLSGAGGMMGECDRIRDGLASGGVDRAIEVFDWSRGEVLSDQVGVAENRKTAQRLAGRLESYLAEHPGRPVHLVGISAGTGLIIWALEDLATPIDGAVIMASSLDTKYNLAGALAKVRDHIYSFGSPVDPVLGLGVTWAGTVDRGGGLAGGLVGFSPPDNAPDADKELYKEKLVQYSWWPGDWLLGNTGTHLGSTNPTFVRVRIAPIILGKELPAPDAAAAAGKKAAQAETAAKGRDRTSYTGRVYASRATPRKDEGTKTAEKRRFFGWNVGRGSDSSASGSAPHAPPEKIDESQFFAETRPLP